MCVHSEDAMELCAEYGLYLKPVAKILISIAMPSHAAHSAKVDKFYSHFGVVDLPYPT